MSFVVFLLNFWMLILGLQLTRLLHCNTRT